MEQIKQRKCKNEGCGKMFTPPPNRVQSCCSGKCTNERKKASENAKKARQTESKANERKMLLEIAQATVNAYVRARDKDVPCICCGKPLDKNYHAGHFFSSGGHSAVRFDEDNIHAQRSDCNTNHAADTQGRYAVRLEDKIGADMFEILRSRAYEPKKWEVHELKSIISEFRKKLKELALNS